MLDPASCVVMGRNCPFSFSLPMGGNGQQCAQTSPLQTAMAAASRRFGTSSLERMLDT
jgi:hypothetical protein